MWYLSFSTSIDEKKNGGRIQLKWKRSINDGKQSQCRLEVQGRWTRLMAYAQGGALLIALHGIENQNTQKAAIIYSLLGTCKLHHMNPQEWFMRHVKSCQKSKHI
jgi:hypothetical protein